MAGEEAGSQSGAGIGAAGVQGVAGLLQQLMAQQAARAAMVQQYKIDKEQQAQARLAQTQHEQLGLIQNMGQGEQGALGNLIAVLQRTAR